MLRGVIFDYGNTLIGLHEPFRSGRSDYGDVVARPGAERLAGVLKAEGLLDAGDRVSAFVELFLKLREENRLRAEETGEEITAADSLRGALQQLGVPAPPGGIIRRALAEHFAPELEVVGALPGADETLAALRSGGVKVALLSNATDGAYVAEVARHLGWGGAFDPLVVSADIGVRKPRPEAFRAVLDRWPFRPDEVAMVGDSLHHDIAGAERLGLYTIHFTAIEHPEDSKHLASIRPRLAVSSHSELRHALIPLVT